MQTELAPNPDSPHTRDPLDIEELFRLYANDVLRVCTVYLGKRSLAEDAFQDVFVKVCQKSDTYRGDTPVLYWLLAIARNVCRDYLRSAWLSRVVSYDEWTENSAGAFPARRRKPVNTGREEDAILSRGSADSPLLKAVLALPSRYKDVILLRYYFDLSNAEIAAQLDITESSVRSRLFRVRKKLAAFMEGEEMPHVP